MRSGHWSITIKNNNDDYVTTRCADEFSAALAIAIEDARISYPLNVLAETINTILFEQESSVETTHAEEDFKNGVERYLGALKRYREDSERESA